MNFRVCHHTVNLGNTISTLTLIECVTYNLVREIQFKKVNMGGTNLVQVRTKLAGITEGYTKPKLCTTESVIKTLSTIKS